MDDRHLQERLSVVWAYFWGACGVVSGSRTRASAVAESLERAS